MRLRLRLTALAALGLALPAAAEAEDVFKIGSSLGLTGYAAVTDRAWRDGLTLAVDALNAQGGIDGHPVKLDFCDTQYTNSGEIACMDKMISDKVSAVIAPSAGASASATDRSSFDSSSGVDSAS